MEYATAPVSVLFRLTCSRTTLPLPKKRVTCVSEYRGVLSNTSNKKWFGFDVGVSCITMRSSMRIVKIEFSEWHVP